MREIGDEKKCPHCGYHVDTVQSAPYLPVRTLIANRYLVGKILDFNAEGATYIGWDIIEKKAVNIREFIPNSLTTRSSVNLNLQVMLGSEATFAELRRSFEALWSTLAKLSGLSALINVTDVVEDYSTSYAVYDHFDGISLRDFLLRSKTGYIGWEKARQLLMPTLSTLGSLHKNGIIHRGISPTTLVIGEDGKIKITGFSIGEIRTEGSRLSAQLYDGYAAVEQCGYNAQQGPWTDFYAFAGVLYRTLIGSDPIPSKERITNDRLMVPGKFAEALPAYVINGLINALQILPQDRTKTVEQLRADLSASPIVTASGVQYSRQQQSNSTAQKAATPQAPAKKKKKKKMSAGATIGLTAGIIALVGIVTFTALALTVFRDKLNITLPGKGEETTISLDTDGTVTVPNFVEKGYYDVVGNEVFTKNFKFRQEEIFSEDVAAGYIISQSLEEGTTVQKGSEIILYVSKGTEKATLPNVSGQDYETALKTLDDLGFEVVKIETSQGSYRENEIIMMSPVAEKTYPKGTKVTLKVFIPETVPETETRSGEVPFTYTTASYDEATTTEYAQANNETND